MPYITLNGIKTDDLKSIKENFYFKKCIIPDLGNEIISYPGDSIITDIDNLAADLHQRFVQKIFANIDEYYRQKSQMPIFVYESGCNSEDVLSKDQFAELIEEYKTKKDLYKHLYLVDCQSMVSSFQSLVIGLNWDFINIYQQMEKIQNDFLKKSGVFILMSSDVELVFSILSSYFIKAYSIMDILTKITFEVENICTDFANYNYLKSRKLLLGDKKRLTKIK